VPKTILAVVYVDLEKKNLLYKIISNNKHLHKPFFIVQYSSFCVSIFSGGTVIKALKSKTSNVGSFNFRENILSFL